MNCVECLKAPQEACVTLDMPSPDYETCVGIFQATPQSEGQTRPGADQWHGGALRVPLWPH